MTLTRHRFLTGAAALGATALGATACTSPTTANPGKITLWYSANGLSEKRPALTFLGIFTFVNAWNDYLWPLVVLIDSNHVTLQVALAQ